MIPLIERFPGKPVQFQFPVVLALNEDEDTNEQSIDKEQDVRERMMESHINDHRWKRQKGMGPLKRIIPFQPVDQLLPDHVLCFIQFLPSSPCKPCYHDVSGWIQNKAMDLNQPKQRITPPSDQEIFREIMLNGLPVEPQTAMSPLRSSPPQNTYPSRPCPWPVSYPGACS